MPEPFSIRTRDLPDVILLRVRGEIDLTSAPALNDAVMSALATRRHVIVSIQDVSYIDMAGFHVLEAAQDAASAGQRIALIGSPPNVKRVIRILQFDSVVSVFEDEEAALAFVRAGRPSAETS